MLGVERSKEDWHGARWRAAFGRGFHPRLQGAINKGLTTPKHPAMAVPGSDLPLSRPATAGAGAKNLRGSQRMGSEGATKGSGRSEKP